MHLNLQLNAIACHIVALLWIPIAAALALGVGNSHLGNIMFLGSLAIAADWDHSANFTGMAWLTAIVLVSILLIIWMPLTIVLINLNPMVNEVRHPDKLVYRSGINAFNWLISCIIWLTVAIILVEWLDRLIPPPENPVWITWSLGLLILMLAIGQIIMAIRACWGILNGKSNRYFFAFPVLR
jgi:heme/copper-type cytochrome/quinol oxidase subunit 2